ncbi:MAG: efflux RND transporter permease subunit [Cyanobacteria bacterium P01_E01_bin.6]
MNLSAWSIRKPIPTIVLFLVLTLAGWLGFTQLEIDDTPNIDIPVVQVTVTQQGAGPAELESQVTKIIEDAVAGIGNIDTLTSTVNDGISTTLVNFDLGTDSDRATNDVRNAIAQVRQDLPQDISDPIVQRLEFAGGSVMTYAVGSNQRSVEELSDLVDRTISRALLDVTGVAQVQRVGGVDREIRVDLSPERLQALGITATEVNDQIRAFNINLPGGRADLGTGETNIRTLGSAATVDTLMQYEITLPNGGSLPLSSLGSVTDSFGELSQLARFNGEPVVAFSVLRSTGTSIVSVEEGVRAKVEELRPTLDDDITLELIVTSANDVRESYQATIDALIIGALLTVVAVGFFLKDWRPTLITAVTLPLSIIPTFLVMRLFGYTLNGMTLLALALAVGILVDDAIVEIENIERHIGMGKSPMKAALEASAEIGLAVVATTATIVAVFIPVAFMGGVPGQFFQPFGVVVSVSVMFSTLVARTMTNLLGARLLKPKTPKASDKLAPIPGADAAGIGRSRPGLYERILVWSLRHRVATLGMAIAFFIGSLQLVPYIPTGLFDSGDTGLSTISVELPPGATLEETDRVTQRLTALLEEHPATASILTAVGEGSGSARGVDAATAYVNLKPDSERDVTQQEFESEMREQFRQIPGARISFESQGAGGGGKDLTLVLKSENADELLTASRALEQQMKAIPGLVEVNSSASLVKPELLIRPDPSRAADLGVSVQAIARTASLATLGDIEANLAKFDLPDRQIPIRVQIAPEARNDLNTIRNLRVPSNAGTLVPLTAVADITLGSGPAQVDRFDRSRQVTLGANLQGISLGNALKAVTALSAFQNLPESVSQQPSGDAEIMRDVFSRFGMALATAILCIYAILVLLYNGFLHPLTIMVALPLSIGGALLGLLVAQKELGLFALIGIVLLMGIVTKNSILLVDYALMNKEEGKSRAQSALEAGISRLRPIMMTALATIAGMLPIALELGAGSEVRSPMAIAVIGGFTTSTLLTLVVVPVIFTYVDAFQDGVANLFKRRRRKANTIKTLKREFDKTPSS